MNCQLSEDPESMIVPQDYRLPLPSHHPWQLLSLASVKHVRIHGNRVEARGDDADVFGESTIRGQILTLLSVYRLTKHPRRQ